MRLTERNVSASKKESIEDSVRTRVMDYIESLPMGADLIYNKLLGRIVEPEEILDAVLLIGAASGGEFYKLNLATDGRKAKIDIHNVFVGLMDEVVFIDILVQLEPKNADVRAEVTQDHHSAVEDTINRTLAATQDKLSKANVKLEISAVIETIEPTLQLIAGNAVVVNAEYEETGRLLNDTDEVALEEHQVPELRQLTIEIPGVLDV